MSFDCKYYNNRRKLDKETIELLEQIKAFRYPLLHPKYNTLGELHNTLTVEITEELDNDGTHIERISIAGIKARIKELKTEQETIERENDVLLKKMHNTTDFNLRNQFERQIKPFHGGDELESLESVLRQYSNKPDDYVVEIEHPYHRSGYYSRSGDDAKIVLEHTGWIYGIISIYIHEMMHAFYDSARSGSFPNSIEYVEEPLAEYGMLKFLSVYVKAHPEHKRLLDDAISTVNEKQYTLGISHYAFGEYLYQNYTHIEWEKLMLDAKNRVDIGSEDYKSLQSIFQSRPNKSNWDKAVQLLYDILTKANGMTSARIARQTTTKHKTANTQNNNPLLDIDKSIYDAWIERYMESRILPSMEEMEEAMNNAKNHGVSIAPVDPHQPKKHVVNHTRGLKVIFPDGSVICERTANDTLVRTLIRIGLDKVAKSGIERGGGYGLVSKTKRPTQGETWQHKVAGGWYIYVKTNNQQKKEDLKKLSDMYDLGLVIMDAN